MVKIKVFTVQCLPCYMMSKVGHLAVFLSHLAQNMLTIATM